MPAATAVDTAEQLRRSGQPRHAFAGLVPAAITPQIASQLGRSSTEGVIVPHVTPRGAAERAGLYPGDVITAVDGQPTPTPEDFLAALRPHEPGDILRLTVRTPARGEPHRRPDRYRQTLVGSGVVNVPSPVWWATISAVVALLAFDFVFHVRKAHVPLLREASVWSAVYVGLAVLFGVGVWLFGGAEMGAEYFAGYVTEKALSVDNLFVFLIIMVSFKVPRADQQKVLLFGIVFSLVARTGFIFLGAALINSFAWVFYLFGLVLLITAGNLVKPEGADSHSAENVMVRLARRLFHTTDYYDGDKLFTIHDGKRALTPMLLVMVAIGGTDVLFALDSIPAIFGLTQNVYLVFTATAFSLLGLRQLYFLIDGLLDRLVYLAYGLAAILAFIGVKLILHALHENNVPFINDGQPVAVVEISTGLSLSIILGVLLVTVVASLVSAKGRAQNAVTAARHHALEYLEVEADPARREELYTQLLAEIQVIKGLPEKYRKRIREEEKLMALLQRARDEHEQTEQAPTGSRGSV